VVINSGHPSYDCSLRTLLSFRDRMPSALTARPSSSYYLYFIFVYNNVEQKAFLIIIDLSYSIFDNKAAITPQ
jgi:hypothetical protein